MNTDEQTSLPKGGPLPEYEPRTLAQCLGYLVEECGEVLHAVGKTQRWGPSAYNPELPTEKQEPNIRWIERELLDLEAAILRARNAIKQERDRYHHD